MEALSDQLITIDYKIKAKEPLTPVEEALKEKWIKDDHRGKELTINIDMLGQLIRFEERMETALQELRPRLECSNENESVPYPADSVLEEKKQVYPLKRWIVAATVFLLVSLGGWFLYRSIRMDSAQQAVTDRNNEMKISDSTVTLVRGDGSILSIDDDSKNINYKEGTTTISIPEAGLLAYTTGQPEDGKAGPINTLYVPKGGQYRILLPDGSQVRLNAGSRLSYPSTFDSTIRKVEISGEGYFEVAKANDWPFIVTKDTVSVEVLGTHFNVKAHTDQESIIVTLMEGAIRVKTPRLTQNMLPMQQITVTKKGLQLSDLTDLTEVTGWRDQQFHFHRRDIKTIMDELARWYNKELIYEDAGIPSEFEMNQVSRKLPLNEILSMLKRTKSVDFVQKGDTIIIRKKSNHP